MRKNRSKHKAKSKTATKSKIPSSKASKPQFGKKIGHVSKNESQSPLKNISIPIQAYGFVCGGYIAALLLYFTSDKFSLGSLILFFEINTYILANLYYAKHLNMKIIRWAVIILTVALIPFFFDLIHHYDKSLNFFNNIVFKLVNMLCTKTFSECLVVLLLAGYIDYGYNKGFGNKTINITSFFLLIIIIGFSMYDTPCYTWEEMHRDFNVLEEFGDVVYLVNLALFFGIDFYMVYLKIHSEKHKRHSLKLITQTK